MPQSFSAAPALSRTSRQCLPSENAKRSSTAAVNSSLLPKMVIERALWRTGRVPDLMQTGGAVAVLDGRRAVSPERVHCENSSLSASRFCCGSAQPFGSGAFGQTPARWIGRGEGGVTEQGYPQCFINEAPSKHRPPGGRRAQTDRNQTVGLFKMCWGVGRLIHPVAGDVNRVNRSGVLDVIERVPVEHD